MKVLRQWTKFNTLLKSVFPSPTTPPPEPTLEDLLNRALGPPAISISPIPGTASILVVFAVGSTLKRVRIDVRENGEVGTDIEGDLGERAGKLIAGAGIGVGIEFLRKELVV
jgi:hypothetical protein